MQLFIYSYSVKNVFHSPILATKPTLHSNLSVLLFVICVLMNACSDNPANAQSSMSTNRKLANDNLLVTLMPHVDRTKFIPAFEKEFKVKVLKDMHVNTEDYSILEIQVPAGKREDVLNKIKTKHDPNIRFVERNYSLQF